MEGERDERRESEMEIERGGRSREMERERRDAG